MLYADGKEAMVGDVVAIDSKYRGVVVADIGAGQFSADDAAEQWAYLRLGILVHTDFAGLVHYPNLDSEHMTLVSRAS
jgi:hypothetical protein